MKYIVIPIPVGPSAKHFLRRPVEDDRHNLWPPRLPTAALGLRVAALGARAFPVVPVPQFVIPRGPLLLRLFRC